MTQEKWEAVEVLLANRLYLYSLLHKTFGREPDRELLALLSADTVGEAFSLLSEEESDPLNRIGPFLQKLGTKKDDPEFIQELKEEYTRLFIGPDKLVAPPWESVYCGEDAMLFQEKPIADSDCSRRDILMSRTTASHWNWPSWQSSPNGRWKTCTTGTSSASGACLRVRRIS